MAPSGKRIKARRRSTTKPRRRTHNKKLSKNQETSLDLAATNSSCITYSKSSKPISFPTNYFQGCNQTPEKESVSAETNGGHSNSCNQTPKNKSISAESNGACSNGAEFISSGCSTPKGQRSRIPEILTCPRAPMKRRVVQNCSVRRGPIAFFAPPDIELFFLFALGHVPAA